MKKLLLVLGTAAAIVTPVATVIACSATEATDTPATKDINSSKSEAELKVILATAITTIDTANSELGIMIPALVGNDLKTITWDSDVLTLTVVATVTGTQTDATTIYKVVPSIMHNLDGNTEVFVNSDKIVKIKITANSADDATTISGKYIPSTLDGEEVSMMIEKLDAATIATLIEITGPTNAIDETGKLTIATALKKAVTNSTKVYNLNAFTKVTVENGNTVTKIEIISDTSTIDIITAKYLPNSLAGNDESATLLESMDANAMVAVMEITGPTNIVNATGKLTIATALKNAVTTIADGKHILDAFTSVYIRGGGIQTIDIGAVTSDDSAETIAGKYSPHSLVDKTAEGAALIAKLNIQEIAQKIIVYIHNPNDATKLTIATALKNAVI